MSGHYHTNEMPILYTTLQYGKNIYIRGSRIYSRLKFIEMILVPSSSFEHHLHSIKT